ncbi:MAG: glycosyl transferase family 2 [Planctomycetaceae bacterium]|nr:glycosyl transferase family 2 [Planctomycetaceae bacterium]
MTSLESIFWVCASGVLYAYVGFPILVWGISRFYQNPVDVANEQASPTEWPMVSLVIAAYKEEKVILPRLVNATLLDYPAEKLEILVGVDGSEDCTGDLVREFVDSRVRLIQYPVRRGKASVLNDTVPQARGEIIVFSDANTMTQPNSIKQLVRHFAESQVGAVCGKLELIDAASGQNVDGIYWKYENFIKGCEGRINALLGVNGGIYALRKELYEPIPTNAIVDDFLIGMRVHLRGRRLIYDPSAVALEETPDTIGQEFQRRSRIGAGGFQSLQWLWPLLSPTYGWVSFAFWSHKIYRWMCPLLMVGALATNIALASQPIYLTLLICQLAFYLIAGVGLGWLTGNRMPRALRLPAMFVSMNAALLVGLWRSLRGIRGGTWKRTERTQPLEVVSK